MRKGFQQIFFRCALIAPIILLSACSLGPDYKHPEMSVPSAWNDQQNSAAAWPSATWWQGFSSPELNNLITKAQQGNFDLAAAVARVKEADAQARIAGAPLLPAVSAGADATHERTIASGTSGVGTTFHQYNPEITASYELDFWGKNRAALESARATANASRYDRATVELTIMTQIASTYFQALQLQDRIKIAEQNRANAKDTLKGLQTELKVGTATALDVAQQDTTVAALSASIPPLRQQLRQTVDALALLIGQPPEKFDIPPASLIHLTEPKVSPGLPSELLTRRPDVAEAEENLIAANANIKEARAAMFPSISLTASDGFESAALSTALSPASRVFALTAGLTQPIFEGGLLEGAFEFNKARYDELLADYHKAVIGAFGNVEDALTVVRQTTEQRKEQQKSVDKAQLAYDLAMAQFHAGTINILTVLSTETALFTARDSLAQVQLAHLQAILQLYNALGGGWLPAQEKNNG
jgi:multidrug efflux system outer membrane protein